MISRIFHKGSVVGGMLLMAGSCIGAGMLALPIITGLGGFFFSILMIVSTWAFMTFTGLLVLEINSWFTHRVNIVSMVGKSFGFAGRAISWVVYLFLFYSLMVAYITGSGNILSTAVYNIFTVVLTPQFIGIIFVIVFGAVIYLGTTYVDFLNRALMIGLIASYLGIVFLGLRFIHFRNLGHLDVHYSLFGLPVLITSFGFHNMIPTMVTYMDYDYQKVKKAIIGGGLIVLVVYLLWEMFVLGVIPYQNLFSSYAKGIEASQLLIHFLRSTWTGFFVQCFAFFAIVTSFLAQGLALMHFIADGFKVYPTRKHNVWLILVTLIPPTVFAVTNPTIFFKALSFAGGICAVILFCVLPALMLWKGRYIQQLSSRYTAFGGKKALIVVIAFSFFIIIQEILRLVSE